MKTPDVIISETSKGTKYAIATGTELNAIENRQPAEWERNERIWYDDISDISFGVAAFSWPRRRFNANVHIRIGVVWRIWGLLHFIVHRDGVY